MTDDSRYECIYRSKPYHAKVMGHVKGVFGHHWIIEDESDCRHGIH